MRRRAAAWSRSRAADSGNFSVAAQINGARVSMVLDTGASSVVLTQEAAKAAGLPLEVLTYTVNVDTANGRTRAAPVTLDRIAVGGIVERSVPALIAQPGQLRTNLLGMSFLNRLESWEVRGDKLVMRGLSLSAHPAMRLTRKRIARRQQKKPERDLELRVWTSHARAAPHRARSGSRPAPSAQSRSATRSRSRAAASAPDAAARRAYSRSCPRS